MENDFLKTIVMKLGSSNCQIGLGGEERPFDSFPSKFGVPSNSHISHFYPKNNSIFLAHEIEENFGFLNTSPIIHNGLIINYENYSKLINYIYTRILKTDSLNSNVLLIESPFIPNKENEKKIEIFFEKFKINGICFCDKGVCSMYSSGRFTGIVHGSGENKTYYYPVFDGFEIKSGMSYMNFGGGDINEYLYILLMGRDKEICGLNKSEAMEITREIKEKCCYVSLNYKEEINDIEEIKYELPDGNMISLKKERIQCCEYMFEPGFFGNLKIGVGMKLFDCINEMDITIKRSLLNNIILSGGNTLLKGYRDRIYNEVRDYSPIGYKGDVRVVPQLDEDSVWIGGSILASLSTFEREYLIKKDEYLENGTQIIYKKKMNYVFDNMKCNY